MRRAALALALSFLLPVPALAAPAFKHVVIIFQENRTPDNIFGSNPTFEPGVDIATSGVNSKGQTIPLTAVALDNCYDISHAHSGFEDSLKGADLDKVSPAKGCTLPANPQFKYVDNSTGTVQPYFDIAAGYGFANRMFQTNQGPSFPAHQFIFGGTSSPSTESPLFAAENMTTKALGAGCAAASTQTVKLIDASGSETSHKPIFPCFNRPTMANLLDGAAISWRYYSSGPLSIWAAPNAIQNLCQAQTVNGKMQCTGPDWVNDVVPNNPAQVLTDIADCKLAAVSWVTPTAAESDHASINKGTGPQWVASIVNAIGKKSACSATDHYWDDTAILITWDDWGGWFDHVKPFQINVKPPVAWGDGYTYGFRVPLLVVSAYTAAGTVSNSTLDFGSLLYFVERNFALGFVGPGDTIYSHYADFQAKSRGDLSEFFTLTTARTFVPIKTTVSAADFMRAPPSMVVPDDD